MLDVNLIKDNPNLIREYQGYEDELFSLALKQGFIPTEDDLINNFYMKYSDSIMTYMININPNYIVYYEGSNDNIFKLSLDKGYKVTEDDLKKYINLRYNDLFMINTIKDNYNFYKYYKGSNIDVINEAIKQGYIPNKDDLIKYSDICSYDVMNKVIDKDHDLCKYYSGNNEKIIKKIINNMDDNYISLFKICNSNLEREHFILLLDNNIINKLKNINIDLKMLIKYALKTEEIIELINIIKNNKLEDFIEKYKIIKNKYYKDDNNAFGIKRFLNIALNYNRYNNLLESIIDHELTNDQITNLYYLFDNKINININNIDELNNIGYKLDYETMNKINSSSITSIEIKNIILLYICNKSYDEIKYVLSNLINYDTLNKMSKKYDNEDVEILKILMMMIEETINSTDDIYSLRMITSKLIENKDIINKIRPYFYNLEEHIRHVYEVDANNTLTDFNNLDKNALIYKDKYLSNDIINTGGENVYIGNTYIDYIDLQNSNYALYAHVCSTPLKNLVDNQNKGRVFISLSPNSNYGNRYYYMPKKITSVDNVTVGYNKLINGSFIASSNNTLQSNYVTVENNYQFDLSDKINQLEFVDSSSTPYAYPETIVYREGLVPCCVIIQGDEPSSIEIDACAYLSYLLNKKIPLVKTSRVNKFQTNIDSKNNSFSTNKINELKTLKDKVISLPINKNEVSNIIKVKIGGSHDIYRCLIDGKRYLLKPGLQKDRKTIDPYKVFAMECGYKIQKIVNPDGLVNVRIVKLSFEGVSIYCSAIEEIPNIRNYALLEDKLHINLSEKEIKCFLKEFIVDYLIYNYDSKLDNYIVNEQKQVYGIDKEQALKYILSFYNNGWDTAMTYDFNPNNIYSIYKKIFCDYISGFQKIDDSIFNECMNVIKKVELISDNEYLDIFKNFVETYCLQNKLDNTIKGNIYEGLLIRKKMLSSSFIDFVNNLKNAKNNYKVR